MDNFIVCPKCGKETFYTKSKCSFCGTDLNSIDEDINLTDIDLEKDKQQNTTSAESSKLTDDKQENTKEESGGSISSFFSLAMLLISGYIMYSVVSDNDPLNAFTSSDKQIAIDTCTSYINKEFKFKPQVSNIVEIGKLKYTFDTTFKVKGKVVGDKMSWKCEYYPEEGMAYTSITPYVNIPVA